MRTDHSKINTHLTLGSKLHTCRMKANIVADEGIRLELRGHTITGDANHVYTGVKARLCLRMSKADFLTLYEAMHRANLQLHEER